MANANDMTAGAPLLATVDNLYEVVAMLRPDLCLLPRRAVDSAISSLIEAKRGGGAAEPQQHPIARAAH